MFHHLYPQRKKRGSVLICLLSNAWVGDSFKLLTVITHTRMHTNTHTYTQHDRCLQHYVVSCICVYLCVWALSCVHPNVCVCVCRVYMFLSQCVFLLRGKHDSPNECKISERWDGGVITKGWLILNDRWAVAGGRDDVGWKNCDYAHKWIFFSPLTMNRNYVDCSLDYKTSLIYLFMIFFNRLIHVLF